MCNATLRTKLLLYSSTLMGQLRNTIVLWLCRYNGFDDKFIEESK